jgi:hypothetical protein
MLYDNEVEVEHGRPINAHSNLSKRYLHHLSLVCAKISFRQVAVSVDRTSMFNLYLIVIQHCTARSAKHARQFFNVFFALLATSTASQATASLILPVIESKWFRKSHLCSKDFKRCLNFNTATFSTVSAAWPYCRDQNRFSGSRLRSSIRTCLIFIAFTN